MEQESRAAEPNNIARRKAQEQYSGSTHSCAREQFEAFLKGWLECEKIFELNGSYSRERVESLEEKVSDLEILLEAAKRGIEQRESQLSAIQERNNIAENALSGIANSCDNENPTHETLWRIAYDAIEKLKLKTP